MYAALETTNSMTTDQPFIGKILENAPDISAVFVGIFARAPTSRNILSNCCP